ncbi:MAG TPA: FkbM family methyltransferase [Bryobacteraceae bacterium]|nr:FkbM family methyltransferase [Bryobacteraceae bacterium]
MAQQRPGRYLVSYILLRSGWCKHFTIKRPNYLLRFHPSNLSRYFWYDPTDRCDEERALCDLVGKGAFCVDVGANIGSVALSLSRAVGPAGRVLAIEPHPRIYAFLSENLALNGASNVNALNIACGDEEGDAYFTDNKYDDMNRIVRDSGTPIKIARLDRIRELREVPVIDLLKIDVEGYELSALKGASGILARCRLVYFECFDENFERFGYSAGDIVRFLNEMNFDVTTLDGKMVSETYRAPELTNLLARPRFAIH